MAGLQASTSSFTGSQLPRWAPSRRAQAGGRRQQLQVSAQSSDEKKLLKKGGSLDERIASGEFTDAGSTKERLTRPLRRALAKDPVGPGAPLGLAALCMLLHLLSAAAQCRRYDQAAASP